MFTIKLFRKGRVRMAEAVSFTIVEESDHLKGITLHRPNQVDDEVYYVGTITEDTSYADTHRTYDRAIIENSAGKTSEVIYAPPIDKDAAGGDGNRYPKAS